MNAAARAVAPALLLMLCACGARSTLDIDDSPLDAPFASWCAPGEVCTVAAECEAGALTEQEHRLVFPSGPGCVFGQGSNLSEKDGEVRARVEQVVSLPLDSGAVICDMEIDIPTTDFHYDDHFMLVFNRAVLMSSVDLDADPIFDTVADFYAYEWLRLIGYPLEFYTYCAGWSQGLGVCTLPNTEQLGPMSLELDTELVQQLGYGAQQTGRSDFAAITTGDNDPDKDCRHSGFELIVTLTTAAE